MLKARAVSRSITPSALPVALGGYGPEHNGSRVAQPLEVNCLCLEDETGVIVLVTVDLLYVTHDLRRTVISRVGDLGLDASHLFFAASHTHYAPAIDATKPLLGDPDSEYLERVGAIVADAIREAVLGFKEAVTVEVRMGKTRIGVNRRRKRAVRVLRTGLEFNGVGMSPNPAGSTDPLTWVISLKSSGRTIAHVWSAACHPTGLADGACVSAHWPGVAREHLRTLVEGHADDEVPVLFLQGFSGDVRPPSGRLKSGSVKAALKRFCLGPTFENLDPHEYATWADSAARQVAEIAWLPPGVPVEGALTCERTELPATRFARGAEGLPPVSFHRVSIGPVAIVGASAELVSGYASQVRALAPDQHVLTVGCIDHVIGYWPLRHMFQEGGYEVVHHCPSFGIEACDPDIEAIVMQEFQRLLRTRTSDARE